MAEEIELEVVDIVNEFDEVVDVQPRALAHANGLWHRGVHIFLFAPNGQMLIQRRGEHCAQFPMHLDCAVSEHLQSSETYWTAARRGLMEELSIDSTALERKLHFKMPYCPGDNMISTVFFGEVEPDLIEIDPLEIDCIELISIDALKLLLMRDKNRLTPWFEQLLYWFFEQPSKVQPMALRDFN